jgi:hypothetical protein
MCAHDKGEINDSAVKGNLLESWNQVTTEISTQVGIEAFTQNKAMNNHLKINSRFFG